MISKAKSHHFTAFITFFAGISFLFEHYLLVSPALIGPLALLSWVPYFNPIHVWGALFVAGSLGIMISWTPALRAFFLICGAASWALFAATSLFESLIGDRASTTGSLLGIVLLGLVFRFLVAIHTVVTDFTTRKSRATINA